MKILSLLLSRAVFCLAYLSVLPVVVASSVSREISGASAVTNSPAAEARAGDIFSILSRPGAKQREGMAACVFDFEPSGSTWTAGLDEQKVFLAALKAGELRLGIGKGGQIYSLRGSFGESIPPQRVNAPWIDEVWHLVATSTELVTPIHHFQNSDPDKNWLPGMPIQYFIHQAGIYLKGLTGTEKTGAPSEPFYSPLLRCRWDQKTRTLYLANWAQQARSPNVWKSGVIVLTSYRDLGDGAIEVTQALSNFGEEVLTYVNAPWGGVRHSSLPQTVLSSPDGGWKKVEGKWGWGPIPSAPFKDTGGWMGWTVDVENPQSPSLALVFGREAEGVPPWKMGSDLIRYGTAGDVQTRDYEAVETSCKVRVPKGESVVFRWYLLAGGFAKTRERAQELVSQAGMWKPEFDDSMVLPIWVASGIPSSRGEGKPAFYLYAEPLPGTVPVFKMEDTRSGKIFAAVDPYELTPTAPLANPLPSGHDQHALYQDRVVHYQYESPAKFKELLGFARREASPADNTNNILLLGANNSNLSLWIPAINAP